jgi:hypothetical protein
MQQQRNMLGNTLELVHRFFHYQQRNIVGREIFYHDKQLGKFSVHQQGLLNRSHTQKHYYKFNILPKALDNVAANIPAKDEEN